MKTVMDEILKMEWDMFTDVTNVGGRAFCQDNQAEFLIMRSSQFKAWNEAVLESYLADLKSAQKRGWNIVSEKYARMMEFSHPDEYEKLKDQLPLISQEKKEYINRIVKIQIAWMEILKIEYPLFIATGRPVHSQDDQQGTSTETYLYGELYTYSIETIKKYWEHIKGIIQKGGNIGKEIFTNIAIAQGYSSLDEVEKKLNTAQ